MSQTSRYVLPGTVLIVVFVVILYVITNKIQTQVIGEPRYHMNLDQSAFLVMSHPKMKQVLYFNMPEWINGKEFEGCEYPCKMISGSKEIASAQVVIFHGPRLAREAKPPQKSRGQIWIMHGMESPHHYWNDLSQWNNVFNWTFTYRRDSDVLMPYSGFQHVPNKITISNITAQWKTKDRTSAWMVSNCGTPSKREQYAQSIRKSTAIHVYGGCGKFRCARANENDCMDILQKHYRYYLAFENSLCVDYVTEKGFKTYLHSPSTIPVMRGGSNYSLYFPPGSYLDTKDFDSGNKLGKAMNTSYMENTNMEKLFSWTKSNSINSILYHTSWCSLCEHIHRSEMHTRLYSNIKYWLNDNPRSACKSPKDLMN